MQLDQGALERILDQIVGARAFPRQRTRIASQTGYMGNDVAAGIVHRSISAAGGQHQSQRNACSSGPKTDHRLHS